MATDVMKIAEARTTGRSEHGEQMRQALALEQIADTLEALRLDLRETITALTRVANRIGRGDD
jgi:hypothetical protein